MYQSLSTRKATQLLMDDSSVNWSWSGAEALIKYLEDLEEDTGIRIEFDVVGIRCDYTEYASALEAALQYDFQPPGNDDDDDDDEIEAAALAYLEYRTTVIVFERGVVIANF